MENKTPHILTRKRRANSGFTILQGVMVLTLIGLVIGGWFVGEDLLVLYRVHAQVSQITRFDAAVENFHEKYNGLPGDLVAIMASRQGLPAGDGTPGHGDGDGKISPCNLGWQWNLGCETALFWSHLSVSGMISENFTADSRFTDNRLLQVGAMDPYLPQATSAEGVYIAVWNSDASLPAPRPRLPFGNYYEISRIAGVVDERMTDDSRALTPEQAQAVDSKMDDGMPLSGRVMVNGEADWPKDAWGTLAKPGVSACVYTDNKYNTGYFLRAKAPLCHLAVRFECCGK